MAHDTVLQEILAKQAETTDAGGGNSSQTGVELNGGAVVPMCATEPDADTFRGNYYYNTTINKLFRRLNTKPFKVWKPVGGANF